jgi:phosphoglycerate dehydrogenase-like enzyme
LPEAVLRHSVEISVLKKMPNVIVSPHNAFNTVEAIKRINDTTARNISDFWYGNVPNKVTPAKNLKVNYLLLDMLSLSGTLLGSGQELQMFI